MRIFIPYTPRLQPDAKWREELMAILGDRYRPHRGPVMLRIRFIFERKNPRARHPVTAPPLPALLRGALDELCGTAWEDEHQVVAIHASKEFGNTSGTEAAW